MEYEEKPKSPVGEGVTEQVMVALRRIIRAIDLRSRFLVARYHLTVPQLVVLKELWLRGDVSVGELTRAVHLSHATVTGILDRLEKRGLVQRQRSDRDKRRVQVRLTPSGERVQLRAPPLLQEDFTEEFDKLEDWERTQILSSLQRVVSMMEAKHLEAAPMLTAAPIGAPTTDQEAPPDAGSASDPLASPPAERPPPALHDDIGSAESQAQLAEP